MVAWYRFASGIYMNPKYPKLSVRRLPKGGWVVSYRGDKPRGPYPTLKKAKAMVPKIVKEPWKY